MSRYNARDIANYFILLGIEKGVPIEHLKLQKLLYFAQGWHLGLGEQPLFTEPIQAWEYGPVVPAIYRELKHTGRRPILTPITYLSKGGDVIVPMVREEDEETRRFLNQIWDVYAARDPFELVSITHEVNSPWDIQVKRWGGKRHIEIPHHLLRDFYQKRVEVEKAAEGKG